MQTERPLTASRERKGEGKCSSRALDLSDARTPARGHLISFGPIPRSPHKFPGRHLGHKIIQPKSVRAPSSSISSASCRNDSFRDRAGDELYSWSHWRLCQSIPAGLQATAAAPLRTRQTNHRRGTA
eukprot:364285-Chlamydomonas_euryale.AAC.6